MSRTMCLAGTLAFAVAAVATQIGCDRQLQAESSPSTTTAPSMDARVKTVTVPVEGMSCAACVASVRKNVASIDGVTGVEVSLEQRHAKVRYREEKVSPVRIAESVQKLGYKVGEPRIETSR